MVRFELFYESFRCGSATGELPQFSDFVGKLQSAPPQLVSKNDIKHCCRTSDLSWCGPAQRAGFRGSASWRRRGKHQVQSRCGNEKSKKKNLIFNSRKTYLCTPEFHTHTLLRDVAQPGLIHPNKLTINLIDYFS